ncbi:bromodomain containing 1 [Gaeumannomyces tritici R3-111a-1]|uniref:Bromodomain containing 1 n=1 Tax=Gaeumannomyces tritici (strain R3-111a-1) TaxID=644352 RepID=J3NK95_GAET3|nr:bromodomain containing 1 [Gaeumannomyces tritici R3-111a-1]EJT81699.1 bromodomain containing 1 [Gaeumannomyces tritici R3-111a-1]
MPSAPSTPRRETPSRRRGRPRVSTATTARSSRASGSATEPPHKKRRYVPGGPGGGGRFVDEDGTEIPAEPSVTRPRAPGPASGAASSTPKPTSSSSQNPLGASSAPAFPRRERSTRTRTATSRFEPDDEQFSSAAAITSAVIQSEGYKPREERGWEEFHPNLDIEATFMVFHAEDVDGTAKPVAPTPKPSSQTLTVGAPTPLGASPHKDQDEDNKTAQDGAPETPVDAPPTTRRRVGRPPRDTNTLFGGRMDLSMTPKVPKVLPIHNQTPKERLDLKQPSYRNTDRIALFESKTFGQARYVEKSMMNVGYQESDNYVRPDRMLIKSADANVDEDAEQSSVAKADAGSGASPANALGRVEYDMDEQDDMWLEKYNERRKEGSLETITREIFEITITRIEKEWHALEKRIPKPNPKPPQTHRPRSSSAAAVNGETQAGEEQDSKCAICDDGDCENTNAIVFCDGCDLAVHQECYGVPFIPEGQWLCRKCQLIGRGIPTCIFCPNTDGAFKQTNSSKWAHLLCSMWIPEISLGNHTFMEPVMDVEKVPKTRWRLTCYLCNQRMGACIQCGNKACYQAFHVTCARRARLYLKMKNSQGALAVLDGNMILKAFCDKHCPADYTKENNVAQATKAAKRFYKKAMKGRLWAASQDSAAELAATHRHAIPDHAAEESQMTGVKVNAVLSDKKRGQPQKCWWRLPSGAPVIPLAVLTNVEGAMQRFPFSKRKDFVAEACRYWTLKRESRRGAALLKRLQLQMETFSSMELTRRNFSAMGPSGKPRLQRRIEFAKTLLRDLEQLKTLSEEIVKRERDKLEEAELQQEFVDTCYFPIFKLLLPVIEKAIALDKSVFQDGLAGLQSKLEARYYTTTLSFAHDLCEVIHVGINSAPAASKSQPAQTAPEHADTSPAKSSGFSEARDRKRLGKRMLKAVQPHLENALRAEADIANKPFENMVKELEGMIDASVELRQASITVSQDEAPVEADQDVVMVDTLDEGQIIVAGQGEHVVTLVENEEDPSGAGDGMEVDEAVDHDPGSIVVTTHMDNSLAKANGSMSSTPSVADQVVQVTLDKNDMVMANGTVKPSDTPPADGDYMPMAQPAHTGPLTPPQSNGGLGGGATDVLTDGGLPWYLKGFSVEGTSAAEEQWPGRDAVRSLSEDLTDMDDEELNGLEFDVEDSTITASPVNPAAEATVSASLATPSARKRSGGGAKFRKGVRASARRR